jgi:hypothetical protein
MTSSRDDDAVRTGPRPDVRNGNHAPVKAYERERAKNNLAHEFSSCAGYYLLMSNLPQESKNRSEQISSTAFSASDKLTNENVVQARMELKFKTMMREMEKNWSNVAVLQNKYAYPCNDLMEKPDQRLEYWLRKED